MMVYSYGVKTKMRNVCSRMGIQSLVNPTPWGMGRKSSKTYPDLLNFGNSCVKKTSPDVLEILMNRWSHIGIAFTRSLWYLVATPVRLWYKNFGYKVVRRLSSLTPCFSAMDEHYVGPARHRSAPLFRVGIDCHKGYMILVRAEDEEHPKPIWSVKALSSPNFVWTSPNFCQIEVEYCRSSTCFALI